MYYQSLNFFLGVIYFAFAVFGLHAKKSHRDNTHITYLLAPVSKPYTSRPFLENLAIIDAWLSVQFFRLVRLEHAISAITQQTFFLPSCIKVADR